MTFCIAYQTSNKATWGWVALFITIFLFHKPAYLNFREPFLWVGLATLPFSCQINRHARSFRYFWIAVGLAMLNIGLPTTIGNYCVLVFSIAFIIEQLAGKTNLLWIIHLLLLSPFFHYFNNLVSFPIRLGLSKAAGAMLGFAGFDIEISGNLIKLEGVDFLVDSACAGLYMLQYSLLFAIIMLASQQRCRKPWNWQELTLLISALLFCSITGNLIRIILLVVFRIMPDHWFHEVFGLCIFMLYNLLPFYLVANLLAKKKAEAPTLSSYPAPVVRPVFFSASTWLILCFGLACWRNTTRTTHRVNIGSSVQAAYHVEKINDNVYKLTNERVLIYLKSPVEPYHADHNPLVCWKGSGYEFKHIDTTTIGETEVSVATVEKGDDTIYTMWWFDSGTHRTGSQWAWRWRALCQQEAFYLVNISAEDMETLHREASSLLLKKNIVL